MRLRAARLATLAGLLLFIALASTAAAAIEKVEIEGFAFRPTPVTINAGDTVTWTNKDSAQHSARVVGVGTTPALSQGQSASLTFTVAGTFSYDCGVHGSSMPGIVIVRAATASPPTASPPTLAPTSVPTAAPTLAPTIAPTQQSAATASPAPTATASSAATSAAPSATAAPSIAVAVPTEQAPAPAATSDGGAAPPILIGGAVVAAIAVLAYAVARSRR